MIAGEPVAEFDKSVAARLAMEQARHFLLEERTPFHRVLGLSRDWMLEMVVAPIERGDKPTKFNLSPNGGGYSGLAIAVILTAVRVLSRYRHGHVAASSSHRVSTERLAAAIAMSDSTSQAADIIGMRTGSLIRACRNAGIHIPFLRAPCSGVAV